MQLFGWKTAIIIILLSGLLGALIGRYVISSFGFGYETIIMAAFPLITIFYFMAWVLMWNKGKAESPFKPIIELLSK